MTHALFLALLLAADPAPPQRIALERLRLQDLDGIVRTPGTGFGTKATVFVFLSHECPVATSYSPRLNAIATEAKQHGVEFYGVIADSEVKRADAIAYRKEYGLNFPVFLDTHSDLAWQFRPTHVPEVFVMTPNGRLAYRGRIDDRYAAPGQRNQATKHDLSDAIAAVIAGREPAEPRTKPIGCLFEMTPRSALDLPKEVTFHRHVAPILNARCVQCHRTGEIGPFNLTTYTDASKRSRMLANVTTDRTMPPWKVAPDYGHFRAEMVLSDRELAVLKAWADGGAVEGEREETPPPVPATDGWQLGKPDLILRVPEPFHLPADGPDIQRNFVIPLNIDDDLMVIGAEFKPGNKRIVHHAICLVDSSGIARKYDSLDDGPGYDADKRGWGFMPTGGLGGWAPGSTPQFVPEGYGRYLKGKSDAVLQVHYHPSGKPETDQSELGLYFAKKPVTKPLGGFSVENWEIDIAPHAKGYRRTAAYKLPTNVEIVGTAPHMHLLGKDMKVWAEKPDGQIVPLVHVPKWDFNWQDFYIYRSPIRLPKGTIVRMESTFDNPSDKPIRWGEGTDDEMALCIFEVTCDNLIDLIHLITDDAKERKVVERFFQNRMSRRD